MDNIVYSNNPNEGTVQAQIEGKYRRVTLTRSIDDAEIMYQDNPNVGKVLFTGEDGKKHTATLVMDINGGGDQHNLGWYATQSALETAHPTAEDGDWAIVGATDTVWVWDSDTNAWKDTDQKGQVTSVNGQTGAVTLGINDVAPTQTGKSGYVLGTDGFVAGWVAPEKIQRSALPQASEDELGNVYQFMGATDSTYTNGYFYKCVSDGATPTPAYSWERVDVQPGSSLPSQSGNSGKFLTTDGTSASWSDKPLVNKATGEGLQITTDSTSYIVGGGNTVVGKLFSSVNDITGSTALGSGVGIKIGSTVVGNSARQTSGAYGTALGNGAYVGATGAIQLGVNGENNEAGTLKVSLLTQYGPGQWNNVNYKLLDYDGTIPAARLKNAATSPATMPTLAVADWSSNTQTVTVSGVTATNTVFVSPAPASASDYAAAGIICTAQGTDSLTFTCTTTPTNAITVNVVIIGA